MPSRRYIRNRFKLQNAFPLNDFQRSGDGSDDKLVDQIRAPGVVHHRGVG